MNKKMTSVMIEPELLAKFEENKLETGITTLSGFINYLMHQYFKNAGL